MPERIIDQLSMYSDNNPKKRIARWILNIAYTSIMIGMLAGTSSFFYSACKKNEPLSIAEKLVRKTTKEAEKATFQYLKDKPQLIDRLFEYEGDKRLDYRNMKKLKKIILDRNKTLTQIVEESEAQESEYSTSLFYAQDYTGITIHNKKNRTYTTHFTNKELGKNSTFVPELKMVFDPKNGILYQLNKEKQTLEEAFSNVKDLTILPDGAYFVQENKVVKIIGDGKTAEIYKGDKDTKALRLKKIWNTPYGIVFGYSLPKIVGQTEDLDLRTKVTLATINLEDFDMGKEIDHTTRVVYKNGRLYVSNKDEIVISSTDPPIKISSGLLNDFIDYMVLDVDDDGKDEIVTYETTGEKIRIFKQNGKSHYLFAKVEDAIKFPYENPKADLRMFMPENLKKDLKEELKK